MRLPSAANLVLLLLFLHAGEQTGILDADPGEAEIPLENQLVRFGEPAVGAFFVDQLRHADDAALAIQDGQTKDAARDVTRPLVNLGQEALVLSETVLLRLLNESIPSIKVF